MQNRQRRTHLISPSTFTAAEEEDTTEEDTTEEDTTEEDTTEEDTPEEDITEEDITEEDIITGENKSTEQNPNNN